MTTVTNDKWENPLVALAHEAWQAVSPTLPRQVTDERLLNKAYDFCKKITATYSRSFYLASALLPWEERRSARALYAFCRVADDIVDNLDDDREVALRSWQRRALSEHPPNDDMVALAWSHSRSKYQIPIRYAEQLLDGVTRDLYQRRYESFEELTTYCYGVASTVGLMSMHIVGFQSEEALRYAVKLGVALQLTNILRDVGEDRARDRIYLPQNELKAFGVTEEQIFSGRIDRSWRELMNFQISRARKIYAEAWPGIALLDPSGRLAIAAAASFYAAILDEIEGNDFDVFNHRAYVSKWGKLRKIPRIWLKTKLIATLN